MVAASWWKGDRAPICPKLESVSFWTVLPVPECYFLALGPLASPFGSHAPRYKEKTMRILLYNPDNGVTRNFMPHLWMFLLQALTPVGHEVVLIDGNAQPMDEEAIAQFVDRKSTRLN